MSQMIKWHNTCTIILDVVVQKECAGNVYAKRLSPLAWNPGKAEFADIEMFA